MLSDNNVPYKIEFFKTLNNPTAQVLGPWKFFILKKDKSKVECLLEPIPIISHVNNNKTTIEYKVFVIGILVAAAIIFFLNLYSKT